VRVLIIQPWIRVGGAELLSLHLSAELEARGHEAPIAALFVDPFGLPAIARTRRYRLPPRWLADRFRASRALTYVVGPFVLLALTAAEAGRVDLLNPHNVPAPIVAAIAAWLHRIPIVWEANEVPRPLSREDAGALGPLERLAWLVASPLASLAARAASAIIVLSQKSRDDVQAHYRLDAVVVTPGIDASAFAVSRNPRPAGAPLRLLFVGKLHPQKDPARAVRVAARLTETGHAIRLTVVGDGPQRAALERLASDSGLGGATTFLGQVSFARLRQAYAESDVLLVTADARQSWGLVPFEALASGIPAVVSQEIGAAALLARRDAALVTPADDHAFCAAVERIAADSTLSDRLVANGRRLLEDELTWGRFAERCEDVFRQAVG